MNKINYINIDNINSYNALYEAIVQTPKGYEIGSESFKNKSTSPFQRFYFLENRRNRNEIATKIGALFKEHLLSRYALPEEKAMIERHWQTILNQAVTNIGEEVEDPSLYLQRDKVMALMEELSVVIADIEPKGILAEESEQIEGEEIKNLVRYFLHDSVLDKQVLNKNNLRRILKGFSKADLSAMRKEICAVLHKIAAQLSLQPDKSSLILKMFIGHALALYAITDPVDGETIQVPQQVDGNWKMISYRVQAIRLTSEWIHQEVEALGLVPLNATASPILLFKGTALPGAKGHASTILTDFTPFNSVGQTLYSSGRRAIREWIDDNYKDKKKIQVYGLSLGGSMAYQCGLEHPEKVEIHAYVAPGFLSDKISSKDTLLEGESFLCPTDIVGNLGKHPSGPQIYKVISREKRNPLTAHLRAFGGEETLLLRVNTVWENVRKIRVFLNVLHQVFSVLFFPILALGIIIQCICEKIQELFKRKGLPEESDFLPSVSYA